MTSRFVDANGIRLHLVEEGSGPPVLLLHGFPDFSLSWRHQLPALAHAGFRAVAPDLRGYAESDRPPGVASYAIEHLVGDVLAVARELETTSGTKPVVVGHDWGGVIAWHLAMHHPDALRALVVLNAPHPKPFARELRRLSSSQKFRSLYAAFFQLPWLPEASFVGGDRFLLKRVLAAGPARDRDVRPQYLRAFAEPEALRAAIDYYRAYVRFPPRRIAPVSVPTLVVWGKRDPYLVPALLDGLAKWVPHLGTLVLPDAGHWLQHSHATEVNTALLAFLRGPWRRCLAHLTPERDDQP